MGNPGYDSTAQVFRKRENLSLLQRIKSGLQGTPGSLAVIGAPGFGKTLFLKQWADPGFRSFVLKDVADAFDFGFMILDEESPPDEAEFLGMAATAIAPEEFGTKPMRMNQGEFEKLVKSHVEQEDRAIVLIVDDFHVLSQNPNISLSFFSFLRHLGYNSRVGYVLSSRLDIGDMAINQDVQSSPFWNIFAKIRMGTLREGAVADWLETNHEQWELKDEHVEFLVGISGGIPCLLGPTAEITRRLTEQQKSWDPDQVIESVLDQAAPWLDEIWADVDAAYEDVLTKACIDPDSIGGRDRETLLPLARRGYLNSDDYGFESAALAVDWSRRLGASTETPTRVPRCPAPEPVKSGLLGRIFGR